MRRVVGNLAIQSVLAINLAISWQVAPIFEQLRNLKTFHTFHNTFFFTP